MNCHIPLCQCPNLLLPWLLCPQTGKSPIILDEPRLILHSNARMVLDFFASIPGVNVSAALRGCPYLLTMPSGECMHNNAVALRRHLALDALPADQAGRALARIATQAPWLLVQELSRNVLPMLVLLEQHLGFEKNHVRALVSWGAQAAQPLSVGSCLVHTALAAASFASRISVAGTLSKSQSTSRSKSPLLSANWLSATPPPHLRSSSSQGSCSTAYTT